MLRLTLLALLLLNGLYYAWLHGMLQAYGFAPVAQTEPQRLAQQIRPEALRILTEPELRNAETASRTTAKPVACLQAGLFDAIQSAVLRRSLAAVLPAGSWTLEPAVEPARWIVYMGKYPNPEALAKKRAELASLNLKFEPLTNPALGLGLSLGGYDTQAAATAAYDALNRRGVRTARVVLERAAVNGLMLTLPGVDDAQRARLESLTPVLAGNAWHPCR